MGLGVGNCTGTLLLTGLCVVACGARSELEVDASCVRCEDSGPDAVSVDVHTNDAPRDVARDVSIDVPIDLCGNGVVDPGEQCDLGPDNSDSPIPFRVAQASDSYDVMPITEAESAVTFYDYIGASSHTGIEVQSESRLYLYLDSTTSDLSLIVNHNIFGKGSGRSTATVAGLPTGFSVLLSDDSGELVQTGPTSASGDWNWSSNTDGGVMGPLTCPAAWTITMSESFNKGISSWVWVNSDTTRSTLTMGESVTIQSFPRCRTNCTVPPCGQ